MNLRIIATLFFCMMPIIVAYADDDPETPFPIEERCVAEPIQPPDDWSYSGTLLMSGYAGIHAMQADWDTPRVEAFFYSDDLGDPIDGGQLSPDGRWYAVPIGEAFTEVTNTRYWFTRGIRLYSTVDSFELSTDLNQYNSLLEYARSYGGWTYEVVRWVDDESLIIGGFLFRPFEQTIEVSDLPVAISGFRDFEVSPDWKRIFGYIDSRSDEGIFDSESPDDAINILKTKAIAWRPDSSGFIAEQQIESIRQLSLFNRDGDFIEKLYTSEGGHLDIRRLIAGRNELGWSPDNRYFAFVYDPPLSEPAQLILLDMENRVVINTCLRPVSQPVWSPDGTQIAILSRAIENLKVVILDLDTWVAYDVARHSGISGALRPDMIAWRTND